MRKVLGVALRDLVAPAIGGLIAFAIFAIVFMAVPAHSASAPRIAVIGDSIALGTGEHLCRALPNCHVHAAVGRQSFQTIRHVDVYADILVISVCTNDPTPSECARNVTILRQSVASDTKVIWIVPAWPKWAHDMIIATASGFADGSVIFVAGCCSVQARRHPRSYKAVADDVRLAIASVP